MRTATILAAVLALLAWPVAGQDAEKAKRPANLLTGYLDRANIHPPIQVGPVTIFPISLSREVALGGLLTADEALKKKVLTVEELKSAEVARAKFSNTSKTHMIFLMAGEVLLGGKQNRTLTTDALLGPGTSTILPLYCVQRGRWTGGKKFAGGTTVAPMSVRSKAAQGAGQRAVWTEVARANRRLGSRTDSDDLGEAMKKKENIERLAKIRKRLGPKWPRNCAGIVVARGGKIVSADLFNSADLFERMRDKILDSTLADVTDAKGRGKVEAPTQQAVRNYLQAAYKARFIAGEQRGVGQIYHVRGARHGETLAYEKRILAEAARLERPGPTIRYMLHTAFMEPVIPVKPPPMPAPTPRPPVRRRLQERD